MNSELFQFYVQGLTNNWFAPGSYTVRFPENIESAMCYLEIKLGRKNGGGRQQNPEYQAALKVLESPLMKALS